MLFKYGHKESLGLATMEMLSIGNLSKAIKNSIDKEGLRDESARIMAEHVLNFFGFSDRIIDNILDPEDRDAFYMLEDSGLLTTQREETTLYDGREWRIHYWLFRKERISELIKGFKKKEAEEIIENTSIYDEIPDDIWSRTEILEE